jgi:hypothetical protein
LFAAIFIVLFQSNRQKFSRVELPFESEQC